MLQINFTFLPPSGVGSQPADMVVLLVLHLCHLVGPFPFVLAGPLSLSLSLSNSSHCRVFASLLLWRQEKCTPRTEYVLCFFFFLFLFYNVSDTK